jgi:hypothetical protein
MNGYWIRGRVGAKAPGHPVILPPGLTKGVTQPDAMWIYLLTGYADVICFEHCNKKQNLYDKRSRYIPASHSLLLRLPRTWLNGAIPVTNGNKHRWDAFETGLAAPNANEVVVPIRFLRVFYALPQKLYTEWKSNQTPTGYEFYCRHSSLTTINSPTTQDFLKRMTSKVHFLTTH